MIKESLLNVVAIFFLAWAANCGLNLLYVIGKHFPAFRKIDYPLDLKFYFRNRRLLGDSTTFPGLILVGALSFVVFMLTDYSLFFLIPILVFWGHAGGSFLKRRIGKKDGEYFPLIDHGDYMLTVGVFFVFLSIINIKNLLIILLINYLIHPLASFLAFKLGLKARPF